MAEYPIVSQRGIPSPSGGFRPSLSFDIGEDNLWEQVGNLAKGGQNLLLTMHVQQAEIQFQDAKLQAEDEIDKLGSRLDKNLDEDTYEGELQTSIGTINSFSPKNPLAAREFTKWIKRQTPGWNDRINASKKARLDDKKIAQLDTLEDIGDLPNLAVSLDAAVKTGVITGRRREAGSVVG
jgi:hypothetical protein